MYNPTYLRGPGWAKLQGQRDQQLPRTEIGEKGLGGIEVAEAQENRASFGGDKNVLKLMGVQMRNSMNILKATDITLSVHKLYATCIIS